MRASTTRNVTVLSSKGQIVIPVAMREALGLSEGDRLSLFVDKNRLVLEKVPSRAARREAWLARAFEDYTRDAPEKVWAELDGEDFHDG